MYVMILPFLTVGNVEAPAFGDEPGMKSQLLTLVKSIRTVMRSKYSTCICVLHPNLQHCCLNYI